TGQNSHLSQRLVLEAGGPERARQNFVSHGRSLIPVGSWVCWQDETHTAPGCGGTMFVFCELRLVSAPDKCICKRVSVLLGCSSFFGQCWRPRTRTPRRLSRRHQLPGRNSGCLVPPRITRLAANTWR